MRLPADKTCTYNSDTNFLVQLVVLLPSAGKSRNPSRVLSIVDPHIAAKKNSAKGERIKRCPEMLGQGPLEEVCLLRSDEDWRED
jgi:predicted secreted protein